MPRQIIINSIPQETRVATVEDARILNVQVERRRERGLAGSIYKGRVTRVLPGMQAAFVDIGLPKAAFLPGADFLDGHQSAPAPRRPSWMTRAPASSTDDGAAEEEVFPPPPPLLPIEQRLRESQEVIVQIGKEPIGSKGARVTSHVSLPGRLLVYLPIDSQLGVSRRIEDEDERLRLCSAIESVPGIGGGVIVRTACEGVAADEIQADLRQLHGLWQHIAKTAQQSSAPALLHQDLDVTLRTVRDLRVLDVTKIVVDDPDDYRRILEFVDAVMPDSPPRVELYEEGEPIFGRYGIEAQIQKALEPRVWLRSGGYIVVDTTEALTSIDVNTGRFIGKKDQQETALKTNLEAAHSIAEQLRLREIGGVIVIDFIDMELATDREAVLTTLEEALQVQRTRAEVHGFSELGLVEMTRHRKRENLSQRLCEPCPQCRGKGFVKATATTAYEILRAIRREAQSAPSLRRVEVFLHSAVAAFLTEYEPTALHDLEHELGIEIGLRETGDGSADDYRLTSSQALPGAM